MLPGAPRTYARGREGVALVGLHVSRLGWVFREQPVGDFGIDGHMEIVRNDRATGRLLGVQVKCGRSYFREEDDDGFVHRGEADDLRYWRNHSLPVLLVLADADQGRCYWQVINDETVEETGKGWKVRVPKMQLLDEDSAGRLDDLANGRPDVLRLRRLQADRDLIERVARGERIVLKVTEWVNKSSGRGDFELMLDDNGFESVLSEWTWLLAGWDYEEALPRLFPWAELSLDENVYDSHDEEAWNESCGIWDQEEGCFIIHTKTLDEFRERLGDGLRPYAEDGEVAEWQLELTLNDVGRSFLVVDAYLAEGEL